MSANPLQQLQSDIFHRLQDDPGTAQAKALLIRDSQIESDIEKALGILNASDAGKVGVVIMALMPVADVDDQDVPGPMLSISAAIRVQENPVINFSDSGIGISAEEFGIRVLQLLHHWRIGNRTLFAGKQALTPNLQFLPLVTYDAVVRCSIPLAQLPKASAPFIAGNPGAVTLSCATPGAAIYYTTDGTSPSVKNSAAVLYSAPFAVDSGTLIRAGAFADGFQPSDIDEGTID